MLCIQGVNRNCLKKEVAASGVATGGQGGDCPLASENEKFGNFVLHASRVFVTYIAERSKLT